MTTSQPLFLFFLFIATLNLSYGCTNLPDVTKIIDEAPTKQKSPHILSSRGQLSRQQSKATMEQLKQAVKATDILERHIAVIESITKNPLTKGNKITLLTDGAATYPAMLTAIEQATDHINMESFIFEDDEIGRKFAEALLQKQAAGIQVKLIYDSVGSITTPAAFFERMRAGGIKVVEFNPLNPLEATREWDFTHRDHRKILIIDGRLAIIGGINISKVYSSRPFQRQHNAKPSIHWRDTDIQIEGPAVAEFQQLFLDTWLQQKGLLPAEHNYFPALKSEGKALVRVVGSTPGQDNRIPFIMYVSAITFAEHSIHLTNSYFLPDDQIKQALMEAAGHGVDVKLILPAISDSRVALHAQRFHYAELLQAGVQIYEHSTSLLHAKTAVIDQIWSTVGSTNMEFLSLLNNDEVNAVILSKDFALEMEKMFARDLANSKQIHWVDWQKRPLLLKIKEWFINLIFQWL